MTTLEKTAVASALEPEVDTYQTVLREHASVLDYAKRDPALVATRLQTIHTPGPHRLLLLDETVQPGGNFKYNGAGYRVDQLTDTHDLVTASAGNWGASLAIAATSRGLSLRVLAPKSLVKPKRDLMEYYGAEVVADYPDVASAAEAASNDPDRLFLHPYNDPLTIAGQALVGWRVTQSLIDQAKKKDIDLKAHPVIFLAQRGGGSLETGIASTVRHYKDEQVFGDNVQVWDVRPARLADDKLDGDYDGLAVEEPGTNTAPVVRNPEFVQSSVTVTRAETGWAANLLLRALGGKMVEPSGLTGVAAFEQLSHNPDLPPTTFVAVASGANTTSAAFDRFRHLPAVDNQARYLAELGLNHDEPVWTRRRWGS